LVDRDQILRHVEAARKQAARAREEAEEMTRTAKELHAETLSQRRRLEEARQRGRFGEPSP
jgi:hypothetical protein